MSGTALPTLTIASPGPLQAMADAIQDRLRLVFPARRFEHAMMPARLTRDDWERLVRRPPFIGLGWGGIEPNKGGAPMRRFVGCATWSVFLVTKNQAGPEQLYRGDAQGPGLFDMVHAAVGVLHGWTVPSVGSVEVAKVDNAFAEGWGGVGTGIAALQLEANLALGLADTVSVVPEDVLTTLGIAWAFGENNAIELSDTITTGATVSA